MKTGLKLILASLLTAAAATAAVPPEFPKQETQPGPSREIMEKLKPCFDPAEPYDGAAVIAACTKLIDGFGLSPHGRSSTLAERGIAYLKGNEIAKAEADFSEALRLNPDNARAILGFVAVYTDRKDYTKAGDMLDALARVNPESARWMAYDGNPPPAKGLIDVADLKTMKPGSALAAILHGLVYLSHDNPKQATVEFEKAIDRDDSNALAHAGLGRAWWRLGKQDRALDELGAALARDPELLSVRFDIAFIHRTRQHFDEAAAEYGRIIDRHPDNVDAYDLRGVTYIEAGQPGRSLAQFNKAIELKPDFADAWYNRGNAYEKLLLDDKAVADYSEAIRLQPTASFAYNNRGVVYERLHQTDKAFDDYTMSIKLDPRNINALNNRALIYAARKDYDRAIADFDAAIAISPDYALAWRNRGNAYAASGRDERAIDDLSKAITLAPDRLNYLYERGITFLRQDKFDKAIADFDAVLKTTPDYFLAVANRGEAWLMQDEFDKAIADFERALKLEPKNVEILNRLGLAHMLKREFTPAFDYFAKALAVKPDSYDTLFHRCRAFSLDHKFDLARKDCDRLAELMPDNPATWRRRGQMYDLKKDFAAAVAEYTKAMALRPNDVDFINDRAFSYAAMKDFTHAIADFDAALAKDPKSFPALMGRGDANLTIGATDKAIADADAAVLVEPDNPSAHNSVCWTRGVANRDLEKALAACNRALELKADASSIMDSRAFILFRLGRFDEALKGFEAALAKNAKQAASLFMRGVTKLRLGDKAGGDADIAAAEKLEPGVTAEYAGYGIKP